MQEILHRVKFGRVILVVRNNIYPHQMSSGQCLSLIEKS